MKTQIVVTFLGFILITAGVGGYIYWQSSKESSSDDSLAYTQETDRTTYPENKSSNTTPQTNELKVQGANNVKQTEPVKKSTKFPEPTEFEVYEQYAKNTTASYVDMVAGSGAEAVAGKKVAMLYKGWLTDGTLFDESRKNEQGQIEPFVFELGASQVIAGWDQGILGMKEGGKRRLVIPAVAGYGETGQGPIPPNAMLVFDVELLEVEK